jgi:histidyl-tRNA synthetase
MRFLKSILLLSAFTIRLQADYSPPAETRDYIARDAVLRESILKKIQHVYEKFGFIPQLTPSFEYVKTFTGHHGEGEDLLFHSYDKDKNHLVLRYDQTVPLARVINQYPDLAKSYKRYQIASAFRDDQADAGHFREFTQCDADIVGASSFLADAEVLQIAYEGLKEIGFPKFIIRINNRKIIKGIAEHLSLTTKEEILQLQRAIDYADKAGKRVEKTFDAFMEERKVSPTTVSFLKELIVEPGNVYKALDLLKNKLSDSDFAQKGIQELQTIVACLPKEILPSIHVDALLARGADYYTGFILEGIVPNSNLGAVLGGGRFDNLTEDFGEKKYPAVGLAFGLDRILRAVTILNLEMQLLNQEKVLIFSRQLNIEAKMLDVATIFRNQNISTDIFYDQTNFEDIKTYIHQNQISLVVELKDSGYDIHQIKETGLLGQIQNLLNQ